MRWTLTALAVSLCLPAVAAGQTRQFGDVVYQVPDGWRPAAYAARDGLPPHAGVVASDPSGRFLVFPDEPAPRDLETWLDAKARLWGPVDTDRRVARAERDDGLPMVVFFEPGRRRPAAFAATSTGDRAVWVVFEARRPAGIEAYASTFAQWATGLQFVSAGARPLVEAEPGPLAGVYVGMGTVFGPSGPSVGLRTYVFTRDGWFRRGVPEGEGTAGYDPSADVASEPDLVGAYRLEGRRLVLRYADGDVDEVDVGPGGVGAQADLDGFAFVRAEALPDGARLEGTFRYGQASTAEGVSQGTAQAFQRVVRLDRDGRFSTTEASSFAAQGETYGASSARRGGEVRGTYAVRGGALVLRADDGRQAVLSAVPYGDGLILDGDPYHRQ